MKRNLHSYQNQDAVTADSWKRLASFDFKWFSEPVMFNINEYMIVPSTTQANGIYKYNMDQNKWIKFIDFKKDITIKSHTSAFNKHTNMLHIYTHKQQAFIQLNLNNLQWNIIKNTIDVGIKPKSIIIDNQFHLIGGEKSKKHYVWNKQTMNFEEIFTFKELEIGLVYHELIYIESKKRFLLFGGYNNGYPLKSVYSFNFVNNKWIKLDIKMPRSLYSFGIVQSIDDKYILIFGGVFGYEHYSSNIYVYDIDKNKFNKSIVQCPVPAQFKATVTNNYLNGLCITFGYIRKLNIKVPIDIVHIIVNFIENSKTDNVHLVLHGENRSRNHWKINLSHLLTFSDYCW